MDRQNRWKKILPELLAVILCLLLMGVGISRKEGYHMDELLSFELTDARYNPCICVYTGVGYYENLPEFMHYAQTLLVKEEELENRTDTESVKVLEQVIVLVKPGVEKEETMAVLREEYGYTTEEILLSEGVHGDTVYLLSK